MKQEDIARALGLSKTTVSRALSGKGRISDGTIQRINDYIENEGRRKKFVPSLSRNICVAIPGDRYINSNPYFSECLYGVCDAVSLLDYNVMVVKATENDISEIVKVVEEKKADGIILTRSFEKDKALEYLCTTDFPVAVAGRCAFDNVISVDMDNEKATKELTSLMIAKGFKRFTVIIEDLNYRVNKARYNGFVNALNKKNIPIEKQFIYTGKFYMDLLKTVTSNILSNKTECIICGDDEIAVKVMSWLKNEGYRIPKDVAVASCYNSPTLNFVVPAITAIDVPTRTVGATLGKQMINLLEGVPYNKNVDVDYEILIRKSTGKD